MTGSPILAQAISRAVTPRLLQEMQAALQRGETLTLHRWKITPTEMHPFVEGRPYVGLPIAWDDIQSFRVQLGYLSLVWA